MKESLTAKILIVDDDPHIVRILRAMLGKAGYGAVESVVHPGMAVALYRHFRPDLTLFALTPPYQRGFALMAELRALAEDDYLSILVMSSSGERTLRLRALESGAKDFLTKPIDRIEAITRINNLVEVRMLHRAALDQRRLLTETVGLRTAELRASNAELQATRLEVILRLGRLAESHDGDAAGHIARVTHSATQLAGALGLDAESCGRLFHASAMHDVGKIGVPDQILRKRGRLDAGEMAIMRTHTAIGARVLQGSGDALMTMAEQIALTHHEKWDGSGYPQGLRGDEIPLAGRIVAVCDVFDALTSKRTYKEAWSRADAMGEISRSSGTHFDPDVVRAFVRHVDIVARVSLPARMAG